MKNKKYSHKVSIVMGSNSDYSTMKFCEKILKLLKINYETNIVSAHRTPERMFKYAKSAGMISQSCLCITHSEIHNIKYYTDLAKELINNEVARSLGMPLDLI